MPTRTTASPRAEEEGSKEERRGLEEEGGEREKEERREGREKERKVEFTDTQTAVNVAWRLQQR